MVADYWEIKYFVESRGIRGIKTCYIAHVKEMHGLTRGAAWNREYPRMNPCPLNKIEPIEEALRHFGMIR